MAIYGLLIFDLINQCIALFLAAASSAQDESLDVEDPLLGSFHRQRMGEQI